MQNSNLKFKIFNFLLAFLSFSFFLFTLPYSVSAHLVGQPPFLKINNRYANLYPVPISSLSDFNLPQDLAPENYLVNQPIVFELDKNRLPAPPDVVEKTKYGWDFADGIHGSGLINTHKFTKIGSFIIKIYADDGTTPTPQLLESVLINVMPDKNYALPQAKILVNGKMSQDPLTDIIKADFNNSVALDGLKSTASKSITEYFWDFGDQKSASGGNQSHRYISDLSQVFITLRVKDNNGFIADNFVEVQNSQAEKTSTASTITAPQSVQAKKTNNLPLLILIAVISLVIIFIARKWILAQRHGKR